MSEAPASRNPLKKLRSQLHELRQRHAMRHRPTGFGFVLADRIDFVDGARWDALAGRGGFFLRRGVLRAIEAHGPENISPRYAMVFAGEKLVALVVAQVVTVSGDRIGAGGRAANGSVARGLLRKVLSPATKSAKRHFRERLLVAGNLLSWGCHGVAFAPDEDPAQLWRGVAEALYRLRRSERLSGQADVMMVKDLTAGQVGVEALRTFSYRPIETEPNMVLEIDPVWRTHDDYLGALDAKYRRKFKDLGKKLAAAGCAVEPLADISTHSERLHQLYLAVQANAAVKLVTVSPGYLPQLAIAAGEDFRCTVVRRGDEILGFVTSVRDGDTAIGYYIGFDRAAAADGLPIYLRLLHATVADAIHWRCRRLSLGRTALEPKAGLGAKPEAMAVWLRHRVPVVNWLVRGLLGAVPHAEAPERNPFKALASGPAESAS